MPKRNLTEKQKAEGKARARRAYNIPVNPEKKPVLQEYAGAVSASRKRNIDSPEDVDWLIQEALGPGVKNLNKPFPKK